MFQKNEGLKFKGKYMYLQESKQELSEDSAACLKGVIQYENNL